MSNLLQMRQSMMENWENQLLTNSMSIIYQSRTAAAPSCFLGGDVLIRPYVAVPTVAEWEVDMYLSTFGVQ